MAKYDYDLFVIGAAVAFSPGRPRPAHENRRAQRAHRACQTGGGRPTEKMDVTTGWTFTMFEEVWNYGFPQELQHFANCVQGKETPLETGEDGREVLKIIYAAYQSAGEGRRIEWPYTPPTVDKPIDLWKRGRVA